MSVCIVVADADVAAASEQRARLVRNKSSSSSSLSSYSHENMGEIVKIDYTTWGNKGLMPSKFGRLLQLHLIACMFSAVYVFCHLWAS